jgi:hypothetical protein
MIWQDGHDLAATASIYSGGGIRTRDLRVMRSQRVGRVRAGCPRLLGLWVVRSGRFRSNWNDEWNNGEPGLVWPVLVPMPRLTLKPVGHGRRSKDERPDAGPLVPSYPGDQRERVLARPQQAHRR